MDQSKPYLQDEYIWAEMADWTYMHMEKEPSAVLLGMVE